MEGCREEGNGGSDGLEESRQRDKCRKKQGPLIAVYDALFTKWFWPKQNLARQLKHLKHVAVMEPSRYKSM